MALGTALGSAALSLDRVSGATLIGQPLDVTGVLRLDVSDDPAALCLEADVFHGDTRVDASRVAVTVERVSASEARFRIRSSVAVDEPVVTLYVRAGCIQRSARRYVLLADVASDTPNNNALVSRAATLPVVPLVPGANAAAAGTASTGASSTPAAPASASKAARPAKPRPASPQAAAAASDAGQPRAAESVPAKPQRAAPVDRKPAPGTARLKLEPLDLGPSVDGVPRLRSSRELASAPDGNEQRRAEVMAWWRAINAQPQDVLREAQRVQALEADAKGLRDSSVRTQAELTDLRVRLERAEQTRYLNPLVAALALLLLAALAGAGYFWHLARKRAQGQPAWWRGAKADADSQPDALDSRLPQKAVYTSGKQSAADGVDVDLDFDLGADDPFVASMPFAVAPDGLKKKPGDAAAVIPWSKPVQQPAALEDLSMAPSGSERATLAEDLYDVQQQADFFVALGDFPQAIELLKDHISTQPQTSAVAYLDLLKIYHQLDRRDDYEELRMDFNQAFNAQAPEFDSFGNVGEGLAAHPKAMSRIEALWPSSKVLDLLEESIFRKPGTDGGEAFDLEAYRELLLLHSLAKEVVSPKSATPRPRAAGAGLVGRSVASANDTSDKSWADMDATQNVRANFSETRMQPLGAKPLVVDAPARAPLTTTVDVDFELDDDDVPGPSAVLEPTLSPVTKPAGDDDSTVALGTKAVVAQAAPAPVRDDNLLEFDVFDATTPRESKL